MRDTRAPPGNPSAQSDPPPVVAARRHREPKRMEPGELDRLRSADPGWQGRLNTALGAWMKNHAVRPGSRPILPAASARRKRR